MKFFFNIFKNKVTTAKNEMVNLIFVIDSSVLNKGKLPRNRQLYKTGVFWSIALSIISILGLQILFYKSVIIFSYVWFLFFSIFMFILCANFIRILVALKNSLSVTFFKNIQLLLNSIQ